MSKEVNVQNQTLWMRVHYRLTHLGLKTVLAIIILAAMSLVLLGYLMYEGDSNRKYDLARPGQQDDNQVLTVEDDEADTTSPVTPAAAKQKIENFNKELNGLNGLSTFEAEDLSDQSIQLAPPDQPSL